MPSSLEVAGAATALLALRNCWLVVACALRAWWVSAAIAICAVDVAISSAAVAVNRVLRMGCLLLILTPGGAKRCCAACGRRSSLSARGEAAENGKDCLAEANNRLASACGPGAHASP